MAHNQLRPHLCILICLVFQSLYSSSTLALLPSPILSHPLALAASAASVQKLQSYACYPADRDALLDVLAALQTSLLDWRQERDCCHWEGVTCGSPFNSTPTTTSNSSANPQLYSRVVRLQVRATSSIAAMQRSLPSAVCRLSALISLDLYLNDLIGPIPTCFSHNLTSLQTLDLGVNSLSGSLAPLANLSLLTRLDISWNQLTSFPPLANLSLLTYLDISGNQLTSLPPLANLSLLTYLDISGNQLTSLSPLANLSLLTYLGISLDQSASIPDIRVLEHLHHLAEIQFWDMSLPAYSLGGLFCKLGSLQSLRAAYVTDSSEAAIAASTLPSSLPCKKPASVNLTELDLSEQGYTGPFPTWFAHFARLRSLTLEGNQFEGSIPQGWPQALTQLTYLSLVGNSPDVTSVSLSQEVQNWLFRLPLEGLTLQSMGLTSLDFPCAGFSLLNHTLRILDLADNHISPGHSLLHCLQHHNFSLLSHLTLSENPLALPLQPHMFPVSIQSLDLSNCQLFGGIPSDIGSTLAGAGHFDTHLDLSYNKLTGIIPSSIWNLTGEQSQIYLDNNRLHGPLAPSPGLKVGLLSIANNDLSKASFHNVSHLEILDLSGNQLQGDLENLLGDYSLMTPSLLFLRLDNNQLTASGPISSLAIWNLSTAAISWLSLNKNHFHGELILQEKALIAGGVSIANNSLSKVKFQNVSYLQVLDLSSNQLGGTLESLLGDFSVMRNLTVLFLQSNQLEGSIPSFLGPSAPSLIVMDLSNNKLTGAIPPSLQHLQALQSKVSGEFYYSNLFYTLHQKF